MNKFTPCPKTGNQNNETMKTAESILLECGIDTKCTCHEMYSSRDMCDPDCLWCNYGRYLLPDIKQYSRDCAKQALEDAANNAEIDWEGGTPYIRGMVDKQSILDTEIKTP